MKIFQILILILFSVQIYSQNFELEIKSLQNNEKLPINYKQIHKDSNSLYIELEKTQRKIFKKGYISATYDSIVFQNKNITAFISIGQQYFWKNINFININENELKKIGINKKKFINKPINFEKLESANEKILQYYENSGYPFVALKYDTIIFEQNKISINIEIKKGRLFKIDSIVVMGKVKISNNYLGRYIGIKKNDIYNEEKIKKISTKINNNEFLSQNKSPELEFYHKTAAIYLYLKKQKANRFNGIIGFLPNDKIENRLLITGEVNLKLLNSFKRGEEFEVLWEKLKPATQKLSMNVNLPFLLKTPFGINENFYLHKEDSSYINIQNTIGIQYFYSGINFIKLFLQNKNSIVLQDNAATIDMANIKTTLYGLALYNANFDYKFNPRKGYSLYSETAYGNKLIEDSIKSKQTEANIKMEFYFPLWNNFVVKLQNNSAIIHNNIALYENELYKIGGLRTLRGFDEEALFASFFAINTIELRYLFDKNSNFYIFTDFAYYQKHTLNANFDDYPISFGVGINFSTKAGIFSLNYALGKQQDNPFLIKTGKIHFGFISLF